MTEDEDYTTWKVDQLKAKIRAKDSSIKSTFFVGMKKEDLRGLGKNKFEPMEDPADCSNRWTRGDERKLALLKKGEIEKFERTGIYVRAVKGRLEFLASKCDHIPRNQAVALAMKVLQNSFGSVEDALEHVTSHFDKDFTAFADEITTCNEIEYSSDDDKSYYTDREDEEEPEQQGRNTGGTRRRGNRRTDDEIEIEYSSDDDNSTYLDTEDEEEPEQQGRNTGGTQRRGNRRTDDALELDDGESDDEQNFFDSEKD